MTDKHYSNYSEKLNCDEWREKRVSIIKRDNNVCVKCLNEYYLNRYVRGFILEISKRFSVSTAFNRSDPRFRWNYFEVLLRLDNGKEFNESINTDIEIENTSILQQAKILISYENNKTTIEGIYTGETHPNIKWYYARNLEVHHTYYIDEKLPWEYPDSALITLCSSCHKELHENSEVPVYPPTQS